MAAKTPKEQRPRGRGRPFAPGESGNPAGRPEGSRNAATIALEALLENEAEAITRRCIELALDGDILALRLCLERLLPPRRERRVRIALPEATDAGGIAAVFSGLLRAVAGGELEPAFLSSD